MTTVETIRCPDCGEVLPAEANVCGYCGHRIKGDPTAVVKGARPAIPVGSVVGAILVVAGTLMPWSDALGGMANAWELGLREVADFRLLVGASVLGFGAPLLLLSASALWLSLAGKAVWWRRVFGIGCLLVVTGFYVWLAGEVEPSLTMVEAGPLVASVGGLLLIFGRRSA